MTALSTQLIHHSYTAPDTFEAVQPGVFKASTVFFPNVHALRTQEWKDKSGYTYGLHGTPTTFTLEERVATLEGGRFCVLVTSLWRACEQEQAATACETSNGFAHTSC